MAYASAVPIHILASAAPATPFWQSSAGGIILGGGITIISTVILQLFAERRTARREAESAVGAAKATRIGLQIETITELQEEIEAIAAFIGNALAATTIDRIRIKTTEYMPGLISLGRAGLLCTRLEDDALKLRIRAWLRATREYANTASARSVDAKGIELRETRIAIVDELGTLLKNYHQADGA